MRSSRVHPARHADLNALVRLELACFPASDAFTRRQYRDLLTNPRATVRVIRGDGDLLASSILLRRRTPGGTTSRLYSLAVSPAARGQGLGSRMLRDVIATCRREGIGSLHLEVRASNAAAIALYRKFGFDIIADLRDYYGRGQHGVKMHLEINSAKRQAGR